MAKKNQIQDPDLRRPPSAGGPRRTSQQPTPRMPLQKSALKKAFPYLLAGGSSVGAGILSFLVT